MNPLLLLVFWAVINIMIKRTKTLKKIEQAKIKRAQQLESQPIQNINTQTIQKETPSSNQNKNRSIIDVFKDEIEKEIQREKQKKPVIPEQKKSNKLEQKISNSKFVPEDVIERDSSWRDNYFSANTDIDFDKREEEMKVYHKKSSINIKKDLLKGIIFSEILSEPRSMQNIKRSM